MNGIGGKTIAEAQEAMSLSEYRLWLKYRQRHGSLNLMQRSEWGAALISSVIANVNRDKKHPPFTITDFAPHINDTPISLDDAIKNWD